MATEPATYHAPVFEPTVDEIETLKKLELGEGISMPQALKHHLSGRLYERGFITRNASGEFTIAPIGRDLIRRQNN